MTFPAWAQRRSVVILALMAALAVGGPFSQCHDDEWYPPGPGSSAR